MLGRKYGPPLHGSSFPTEDATARPRNRRRLRLNELSARAPGERPRLAPLSFPDDATGDRSGSTAVTAVPTTAMAVSPSPAPNSVVPYNPPASTAGPSSRLLVAANTPDSQQVSLWPQKPLTAKQKRKAPNNSKAPLALQLEAFIRKEHRQYLLENPDCSRTDTLHIFREAFTVVVDHFTEYKSVLNLIRDEYDATINAMMEQMKRMRVTDLENKSDRSLHAMELIQLKESLNATISNQQAQLKASQGLLSSLREQLAAAEHANSLLRYEMERRLREHDDAKDQVKLLAKAMTEESARTALIVEESAKREKEMELMRAQLKVLKENVQELEACLRAQAERRWRPDKGSQDATMSFQGSDREAIDELVREGRASLISLSAEGLVSAGGRNYTDDYVHTLLSRIDTLEFALASKEKESVRQVELKEQDERDSPTSVPSTAIGDTAVVAVPLKRRGRLGEESFPVLREWLRQEGITEEDVEDSDHLIPPGTWPTEELAFLKACLPVRNRHLTLPDTLQMLEEFWLSRERALDHSRLSEHFLNWLTSLTGGGAALKETGVNLLQSCQRNQHHPECRAILLLLRGFLPEQLVLVWRTQVKSLRDFVGAAAAGEVANEPSVEELFRRVRSLCPGKPQSHVLQLRFYVSRLSTGRQGTVDCTALLAPDSYFVTLLKLQLLREVEEFTLRVVEGVRAAGDAGKNNVSLAKVLEVIRGLDRGISDEALYGFAAAAAQKNLAEVASADAGAPIQVRLDTLLLRFRGAVLLRRTTVDG